MRAVMRAGLVLVVGLAAGCSPANAPAPAQSADAPAAEAPKADALPADVPIPVGLEGRKDSTQPGSGYFVVQGQIPSSVPEAVAEFRKQAESAGWKALGEAPSDDSVATLAFEKETRSLKITLVKAENTVTNMNLMTGPK
ncbi:MAG: hypothetical protein HUU46_12705 [Candidatus Hydrogenedentes bacterium]|nr:hypothetical protein [Candidatus Hydrogenedentota bacterium]